MGFGLIPFVGSALAGKAVFDAVKFKPNYDVRQLRIDTVQNNRDEFNRLVDEYAAPITQTIDDLHKKYPELYTDIEAIAAKHKDFVNSAKTKWDIDKRSGFKNVFKTAERWEKGPFGSKGGRYYVVVGFTDLYYEQLNGEITSLTLSASDKIKDQKAKQQADRDALLASFDNQVGQIADEITARKAQISTDIEQTASLTSSNTTLVVMVVGALAALVAILFILKKPQ
jgi:hypothetical protein